MQTIRRIVTSSKVASISSRRRIPTRTVAATTNHPLHTISPVVISPYGPPAVAGVIVYPNPTQGPSNSDASGTYTWFHKCALFLAASSTAAFLLPSPQDSAQCCGIAGVIGTPDYDAR